LFTAWQEFCRGKRSKADVQVFRFDLENNIFRLNEELKNCTWEPSSYSGFYVRDPKLRHIHKAVVKDRIFNQALFRILYQIFDPVFIYDSYSCRVGKGTHRGVLRLESFIRKASKNYTRPTFALKCDVKKFFDSISHEILLGIIKNKICDGKTFDIISLIVKSFQTVEGKGLPLGNVTSQLFANVYLNELDQFVKHVLKVKYYVRYCDDFIILENDKEKLFDHVRTIESFLGKNLDLKLHPNKISIRKISQGIDFLGYVVLPHYKVLRTKTKRRVLRKVDLLRRNIEEGIITKEFFDSLVQSYLGILKHCRGQQVSEQIKLKTGLSCDFGIISTYN